MTIRFRFLSLLLKGLLILVSASPLLAQLDPRLQVGNTDFLDLYQQSSNAKVKPEVITIFDFSGSMEALMYHPLFPNPTSTTSANGGNIKFTLDPSAGVDANTYTIRVESRENSEAYATIDVTVGGGFRIPIILGSKFRIMANVERVRGTSTPQFLLSPFRMALQQLFHLVPRIPSSPQFHFVRRTTTTIP